MSPVRGCASVPDVEDRQASRAERRQEIGDAVDRVGIVAPGALRLLLVKCLLDIDDDEGGFSPCERLHRAASCNLGESAAVCCDVTAPPELPVQPPGPADGLQVQEPRMLSPGPSHSQRSAPNHPYGPG